MNVQYSAIFNTEKHLITSMMIVLELNAAGRSLLTVQSQSQPLGSLLISANGTPVFLGIIEKSQRLSLNSWEIIARESISILEHSLFLSLRNKTISGILEVIQTKIPLKIQTTPNASFLNKKLPHFFNPGSGILAFDTLAKEARFNAPCCILLPSGSLWFGSYKQAPINKVISLPFRTLSDRSSVSATIPTLYHLRPGMQLQIEDAQTLFIEKIEMTNTFSRLHFSHNPWSTK